MKVQSTLFHWNWYSSLTSHPTLNSLISGAHKRPEITQQRRISNKTNQLKACANHKKQYVFLYDHAML